MENNPYSFEGKLNHEYPELIKKNGSKEIYIINSKKEINN